VRHGHEHQPQRALLHGRVRALTTAVLHRLREEQVALRVQAVEAADEHASVRDLHLHAAGT
jgi:hypothetical protein